jgi:hypothetical protein
MRAALFVLVAFACGLATRARAAEPAPLAGWLGLTPSLLGYAHTFAAPRIGKGDDPAYSQDVEYDWTGGSFRHITLTLTRDPAFKEAHQPEKLARATNPPKEVRLGKRTAWLTVVGDDDTAKSRTLLIPLAEDRAVIVKATGMVTQEELMTFAEQLDLGAIRAALARRPRTDFRRTVDAFRALKKGVPLEAVTDWVGHAEADVGAGIHVLEYNLPGGGKVLLGTPDLKTILYVKYRNKDGMVEDLLGR